MQVVFDNTFLALLLHPGARPPLDPTTKKPIERCQERIAFLVETLRLQGSRILVPTPALAEFLVFAGSDGPKLLDELTSPSSAFRIEPSDTRSAVEAAAIETDARARGSRRSGVAASWQKVKVDRQVIAIARTAGAACVYSDDGDVIAQCEALQMPVVRVASLPLPPAQDQDLPFESDEE